MELYFVRHGETEFNKQHRAMGQRIDGELDEKGFQQAHEVIPKLPKDFTLIYSSPLKRAATTAKIIADYFNKDIRINQNLRERDFGTLSGKTWEDMETETGKPIIQLDDDLQYDYTPYGGESVAQVKARLEDFLNEVRTIHANDKIVVVTHFGIISLMNSIYPHKKHAHESHTLPNTSIHKFEI